MPSEVDEAIIQLLKSNEKLNFGDLKAKSGHPPQDVRKSLQELLNTDDIPVYVKSVEEKTKYYAIKKECL